MTFGITFLLIYYVSGCLSFLGFAYLLDGKITRDSASVVLVAGLMGHLFVLGLIFLSIETFGNWVLDRIFGKMEKFNTSN